jgi:hypothetical protein
MLSQYRVDNAQCVKACPLILTAFRFCLGHVKGRTVPNKQWANFTERRDRVVRTSSHSSRIQISARKPAILAEGFRGCPQSLQENAGVEP